jgi:hypothetical protein
VNTRGTPFTGGAGKPQSSQRNILRRFYATLQRPLTYQTRAMYNPPAPQTLAALRGLTGSSLGIGGGPGDGGGMVLRYDATGSDSSSAMPSAAMLFGHQLLFTVHYGLGFASLLSEEPPRDGNQQQAPGNYGVGGFQLQVRYGNAGGMTTPAFAGGGGGGNSNNNSQQGARDVAVWNQRFSLPLQDMQSPIELFLIDTDAAARNTDPKDGAYLIGGVMIAPPDVQRHAMDGSIATEQTWRAYRGDHVNLPVTTFERRKQSNTDVTQDSAGSATGGRLDDGEELCLCVSWEVVLASQLQDHVDHTDCEEEADLFAPVPIQRNGDVKPPAPPRQTGSERGSSIPASAAGSSAAAPTKYEVEITFEIDRIDRYPSSDTNSKFNPSSALFCMARRSDGECSDYVALRQRSHHAGDGGGYGMYRFDTVEDTGRTCTLTCHIPAPADDDEALRVIQLLVCETDNTEVGEDHRGANEGDVHEGAALRVVASTSLLFTALAPRGSATFVLDSLADDEDGDGEAEKQQQHQQRPYGELCVNWQVTPLQDEQTSWTQAQRLLFPSTSSGEECGEVVAASGNDLTPRSIDSDVLCVTIVRGIDLRRAPLGGELTHNNNAAARKLSRPLVAVAVGPLLASTPIATIPESQLLLHPRAPCNVVWDQELIFPFPATNIPRRTLVELILQQDHEIISIGALLLQDALERSKVLTNVRGGVVEGFEVVPLLQEGHMGALGHILVRWRYIAHDQLALQARNRGRSKSTETSANDEDENQGHDDVGAADLGPTATPVKQRLASASPSRTTEALSALRSSPPPTAQPSPRRVSAVSPQQQTPNDSFAGGSSPRRASPGASLHTSTPPAVMQMSPRRRSVDSCGAPSPMQALQLTEDDVAVQQGGGLVSPQHDESEQVYRGSGGGAKSGVQRSADVAGASEPYDRENEDREVEAVSSHAPLHSDDEDASPNTSVAAPEPRKLVFRVRTGEDGRPQVAFYDPATCSAPASPIRTDTTMQQREEAANGEGVIPPLNGPYHFTRDVSQWSSELHRGAAAPRGGAAATDCVDDADIVKDPAQLLREELEVRNRLGSMKQPPFSRALGKVFPDQPWYPPGESKDELHVPASRRESQRKQLDAIVELTLKSRFVAHQSAARENRGMLSAAVSHDVSRSTSVQQNQLSVMGGLRPHGMHFAN